MSWVRFPSPAPILSTLSRRRFCRRFCTLCSLFVKLPDDRLYGRLAVNVSTEDFSDVLLLPSHDVSDDPLRQAGDVEPCRRRASQVVEVQIGVGHTSGD